MGRKPVSEASPVAANNAYDTLLEVCRNRMTTRSFKPDPTIPREHVESRID